MSRWHIWGRPALHPIVSNDAVQLGLLDTNRKHARSRCALPCQHRARRLSSLPEKPGTHRPAQPPFPVSADLSSNPKEGQTGPPPAPAPRLPVWECPAPRRAEPRLIPASHAHWPNWAPFLGSELDRYDVCGFTGTLKYRRSGRENILADDTSLAVRIIECWPGKVSQRFRG